MWNVISFLLPLSSKPELFEKYSAGAVLPRGIFGYFDEIVKRLIKMRRKVCPLQYARFGCSGKKGGCSDNRRTVFKIFLNSVSLSEIQNARSGGMCALI